MNTRERIAQIERALGGLPVKELCRVAGIDQSTWCRWKNGETEPNVRSWRKVEDAFAALNLLSRRKAKPNEAQQ